MQPFCMGKNALAASQAELRHYRSLTSSVMSLMIGPALKRTLPSPSYNILSNIFVKKTVSFRKEDLQGPTMYRYGPQSGLFGSLDFSA